MAKLLKKNLHVVASQMARDAHRAVNAYCVGQPFVRTPGLVTTHTLNETPKAGVVAWEGFTLEISACRRARIVCNVPTPFSLYTFTLCLKRDGKPIAYGATLGEFETAAMRAIAKLA